MMEEFPCKKPEIHVGVVLVESMTIWFLCVSVAEFPVSIDSPEHILNMKRITHTNSISVEICPLPDGAQDLSATAPLRRD